MEHKRGFRDDGKGVCALIDDDGVPADTERDGHRVAFNQTFAEFGLPRVLTPDFVHQAALPIDWQAQRKLVSRWHRRQRQVFTGLVAISEVPARPSIARIPFEALARGRKLAAS